MSTKRCGNAGAVESVESQRQASHSFHQPLGNLAKGRRDFHIPTAPATKADGKVENQKQVSHFPTATIARSQKQKKEGRRAAPPAGPDSPPDGYGLESSSSAAPGSHAPSGRWRSHTKPTKGDITQQSISCSFRIGIEVPFHAHLALELILDFMLISGLENAIACFSNAWDN
jgi:hypothetical protein